MTLAIGTFAVTLPYVLLAGIILPVIRRRPTDTAPMPSCDQAHLGKLSDAFAVQPGGESADRLVTMSLDA